MIQNNLDVLAPEFADAVGSVMKSARLNQSVTGIAELSRQIDGMEKAALKFIDDTIDLLGINKKH